MPSTTKLYAWKRTEIVNMRYNSMFSWQEERLKLLRERDSNIRKKIQPKILCLTNDDFFPAKTYPSTKFRKLVLKFWSLLKNKKFCYWRNYKLLYTSFLRYFSIFNIIHNETTFESQKNFSHAISLIFKPLWRNFSVHW